MQRLAEKIKLLAKQAGFSAAGICTAQILKKSGKDLAEMVRRGWQGEMHWLAETANQRPAPTAFQPGAKSVLLVALNYLRSDEPFQTPHSAGYISLYARGRDYHKVLRNKLRCLLNDIRREEPETEGRIFVDSYPVMEKPLAVRAGIGWIGKNTTLILKGKGSFFFLGGILLNLELPSDPPFTADYCGSCSRCLQACPTGALRQPGRIDARRCISYLTIEHKKEISPELASKMGNLIFGCDICQAVCPWNRHTTDTAESDFNSRYSENNLLLDRLVNLSKEEFEKMFEGTPVRRAGFDKFIRNVKIARRNQQPEQNVHPASD